MLYGEKKSPRARPLVNDLRVKPTAAAAQAAAASAQREAARVNVDVGGGGLRPGVLRGALGWQAGERGCEHRTEQGGGAASAASSAAQVMWVAFFSLVLPPSFQAVYL